VKSCWMNHPSPSALIALLISWKGLYSKLVKIISCKDTKQFKIGICRNFYNMANRRTSTNVTIIQWIQNWKLKNLSLHRGIRVDLSLWRKFFKVNFDAIWPPGSRPKRTVMGSVRNRWHSLYKHSPLTTFVGCGTIMDF